MDITISEFKFRYDAPSYLQINRDTTKYYFFTNLKTNFSEFLVI